MFLLILYLALRYDAERQAWLSSRSLDDLRVAGLLVAVFCILRGSGESMSVCLVESTVWCGSPTVDACLLALHAPGCLSFLEAGLGEIALVEL